LLPRNSLCIDVGHKSEVGNVLGDFFANSSGHPADGSVAYVSVREDEDVLRLVDDGDVPGLERVFAVARNSVGRQDALVLLQAQLAALVVLNDIPSGET
jgi:hypothetical protein